MQFIDSHIHLQAYNIKDTPQFIADLRKRGVLKLVCPSTSEQDWATVENLSRNQSSVIYPAFGTHPWYVDTISSRWRENLRNKLQKNNHAWVGECGLDRIKNDYFDIQSEVFSEHINIAQEFSRPLIVHAVKSQDWLENYWDKLKNIRFVFHSFVGNIVFMKRIIKFGGYISFSPSILRYKHADELLRYIPINRVLVESDGPYQGDIFDIPQIVNFISDIKNMEALKVLESINQNFKDFLDDK